MKEDEKRMTAALRISSQTVTSQEVTIKLDTQPSRSYEIGTPISRRKPDGPLRKQSLWVLESGLCDETPLDQQISKLAAFAQNKIALIQKLQSDCNVDIFCGFSSGNGQGGFVLGSELIQQLAELKFDLILDLYPPEHNV